VLDGYPYTVECACSDNGTEYKGTDSHSFVSVYTSTSVGQKLARVKSPQTNGKAEWVIRTSVEIYRLLAFDNSSQAYPRAPRNFAKLVLFTLAALNKMGNSDAITHFIAPCYE